MKINKKYMPNGKINLEHVKVFYKDEKINIIIDNNLKFYSNKDDIIYIYVQKGYLSWKKNNKMKGIEEVLEDIKTNGRAT